MKNENQIRTSRDAALKQAKNCSLNVRDCLDILKKGKCPADVMPELRLQLAELNQRVHEFNAYHNCLCA